MPDKKKILIIDDDPDIVSVISTVLNSKGFEVSTAYNSKDGVDEFNRNKPDLVLCDMMMEDIDAGTKVAQKIRKINKKVLIYLLSSIGTATASNIEIDKLGFNGVFQKPVDSDLMVKQLRKVLGIK